MGSFVCALRTKVIYGAGTSKRLGEEIKHLSTSKNPVIVTDQALYDLGVIKPILDELELQGIKTQIYHRVQSNPTIQHINEVASMLREYQSECVIGIGGGSPLDVAKTAALVANGPQGVEHYALMASPFPEKEITCIALPTTAGTGAEVTNTTIFSTLAGRKLWGWDEHMAPEIAILDPELTVALPPVLTTATALDAIVHAIEACTGQRGNPLITALSLQAIQLLQQNLRIVLKEPHQLKAREQLLIGATLAGMAIEHGGTGLAHCIGHGLSTIGGVHHGQAVALALYHVYEWNVLQSTQKADIFAQVARALGVQGEYGSTTELAWQGAQAFKALVEETPLNLNLNQMGLSSAHVAELVQAMNAPENAPMKLNNCSHPTENECVEFSRKVLSDCGR